MMPKDSTRNRFVVGIGSQRAGTTLLHRLLRDSSDIFMHPVKELHYFDTIYNIRPQDALVHFSRRQLSSQIDRIVSSQGPCCLDDAHRCMLRATKMLAFRKVGEIDYADLFRPMLSSRRLLGEFTPEYMLMDKKQVQGMSKVIGAGSFIVLICRNPVDRILSSAKLFNVYNSLGMSQSELEGWLLGQLRQGGAWIKAQDGYNDYERAIEVFSSVFPNFLAIRFEDLISFPSRVSRRLQTFLETTIDPKIFRGGVSRKSNSLGESYVFSGELIAELQNRYSSATRFLSMYFGPD